MQVLLPNKANMHMDCGQLLLFILHHREWAGCKATPPGRWAESSVFGVAAKEPAHGAAEAGRRRHRISVARSGGLTHCMHSW